MPVCMMAVTSGGQAPMKPVYTIVTTAPDGTVTNTQPVTDFSKCDFVVLTGDDYVNNAWRELGSMSMQNASYISMLVAGIWALAYGFKAIGRTLSNPESESE